MVGRAVAARDVWPAAVYAIGDVSSYLAIIASANGVMGRYRSIISSGSTVPSAPKRPITVSWKVW